MDNFELFKELYHKENDRRNEVQNTLNIPIALISGLATGVYFLVTNFDYKVCLYLNFFFYITCILTTICILISSFYLVKSFSNLTKGYEYTGLAYPQKLYDWYIELENYYDAHGNGSDDAKIHFKKHIIEKFVKHANHNMFVNDKKLGYIYNSKKYLIYGLFALFLVMPFYLTNFFMKGENIQKYQLIESNEKKNNKNEENVKIDKINKSSIQNSKVMAEPQRNQTPPPPPPPPPADRIIKEGKEPNSNKGGKK